MNPALPLNKLIILKMLDDVDFPLTNSQITEFMVSFHYAEYFDVQETLSDLKASHLVVEEDIHHSTHYHITETGEQTLNYYKYLLPDSFVSNITKYFNDNKISLRNKVSVVTGYAPISSGEYAVHCQILEKGLPIFDMTIHAPDQEVAETMCFNFEKEQANIYSDILMKLILESESPTPTSSESN